MPESFVNAGPNSSGGLLSLMRRRFSEGRVASAVTETSFVEGEDLIPAAVLVPVIVRETGLTMLLTQRTAHLRDHAGQISFPGGRVEPEDLDRETTALRETEEETGLVLAHDHGPLSLAARAITPTISPVRFHARFFVVDADLAQGEAADSHELADLAWRTLDDSLQLPLFDITEAVLRTLQVEGAPFLMTYRSGTTRVRALD